MDKRHLVIWFCLVTFCGGQLVCQEQHTYLYEYENEIKLWGDVKQSYHVSCNLEIDCIGESPLSEPGKPAYNFTMHISNYKVTGEQISPEDALKLCKKNQQSGSSCGVNDPNDKSKLDDIIVTDQGLFSRPVVFTQRNDGKILRVSFMEKDAENRDVMNFKKGVVSALQTRLTEEDGDDTEEETDSTGTHKTQYKSTKANGEVVIKKKFDSKNDTASAKSNMPVELHMEGETRIQTGEIVSSKGKIISEASKTDDDDDDDKRPGDIVTDIDVGDTLNTESTFTLDLKQTRKRSTHRQRKIAEFKTVKFLENNIVIETEGNSDEFRYEQLETLYARLRQLTMRSILDNFISSKDDSYLKPIRQIITLETELGYDNIRTRLQRTDPPLVDQLIPETYGVVSDCASSWDMCRELLSLYSLGGGVLAEQVLVFLMSTESPLSPEQSLELMDIVSFMVNPSDEFVVSVINLYESSSNDPEKSQSLLLVLGALAGHKSISDHTQLIVVNIIMAELEILPHESCPEENRIINALEAVGNMADQRLLQQVVRIASSCDQSKNIRMAVVHAVRGQLSQPEVDDLLVDTLLRFDCEVTSDMVEILKESMDNPQLSQSQDWPLEGLNQVDSLLIDGLTNTSHLECVRKVSIAYFKAKISPNTDEIVDALLHPPSTSIGTFSTQKRGVDHYTCSYWGDYYGRYSNIQSSSAFAYDRSTYNRRSHCLGHFKIGGSKARADFYAGYFAGARSPSSHLRSKVFGKFVAKGKVFSKSISLANVYSYFEVNGLYQYGRVYVRVGWKTLLSKSFSTPSYNLYSRYYSVSLRIPLARIPVYIMTINIDLTLTAQLGLNLRLTVCSASSVCMQLIPTANAYATAGVSLSLGVIRGGADISIKFNYYVEGEVRANARDLNTCVSLSHGHQRNYIYIEFWYQLIRFEKTRWPPWFKIGWRNKKTWGPSSLKWSFGSASEKRIYSNC